MNIMGLQTIYKGPNTSKKHPQHRIYPYLLRKLAITRPNQVPLSHMQACAAGLRVQRHYLHSGQERLFVFGGDYGLGDPQGFDLAAFQYVGCQLLPSRQIALQSPAGQWMAFKRNGSSIPGLGSTTQNDFTPPLISEHRTSHTSAKRRHKKRHEQKQDAS